MNALLADTATYKQLKKDPTGKYKRELVSLLQGWQRTDPIPMPLYYKLYPTSEETPKLYGTPKIHKADYPLRPIVSSIGSIAYNAARIVADILSPLVGKTSHHIENSADFVEKIKTLEIPPGRKMISYDVSSLFTSIPTDAATEVAETMLRADNTLSTRTPLSVERILALLKFCLNTTYFTYDGVFYQQCKGAAMGSPVSPIVANIYMESF